MKSQAKDYYLDSPEADAILNNATFLQMYVDLIFDTDDGDKDGIITLDEFLTSYHEAMNRQDQSDDTDAEQQNREEL